MRSDSSSRKKIHVARSFLQSPNNVVISNINRIPRPPVRQTTATHPTTSRVNTSLDVTSIVGSPAPRKGFMEEITLRWLARLLEFAAAPRNAHMKLAAQLV